MEMYKEAIVRKVRFVTPKGTLSAEQLYDLSQKDLEVSIKELNKSLKENDNDGLSFLDSASTVDPIQQLRFNILKDVYMTKKAELEAARNAKADKEHNQKILSLIAEKQEEGLKSKSVEELQSLLK